jgi:hypothetical protein
MRGRFLVLLAVAAIGCGGQQSMPTLHARYDADVEVVFREVLDVMQAKYDGVKSTPVTRTIETAWNQIPPGTLPELDKDPSGARKSFYFRFAVRVAGDRPWRVEILGQAAEWTAGQALLEPLRGAAEPGWLSLRTQALSSAIHDRIKQFAVPDGAAPAPAP